MNDADAEMIDGLRDRTIPAASARLARDGFIVLAVIAAFLLWRRFRR